MRSTKPSILGPPWAIVFFVLVIFLATGCSRANAQPAAARPSPQAPRPEVQEEPKPPVPDSLVYADRSVLYTSIDGGQSWTEHRPLPSINSSLYLTAAAIDPRDPKKIVIGTSYQGLYETLDGGETWVRVNGPPTDAVLFQGAGFYDEVSALWIPADATGTLLFRLGFSDRWFVFDRVAATLEEAQSAAALARRFADLPPVYLQDMNLSAGGDEPWLQRRLPLYSDSWPLPPAAETSSARTDTLVADEAWRQRRQTASDRTGIYLNPWQAGNNLDAHLQFVLDHEMNSIVVDFKDDYGRLTYDSDLAIVNAVGSELVRFDARELIRKAHEKGIYVIARHVVFKDRALWRYQNSRYALWDGPQNRAWGVYRQVTPEATEEVPEPEPYWEQIEWWVDPYSDFVHQYNIAIAKELQELGVDEIQFDYIRFPSDGATGNIRSRFFALRNQDQRPAGFSDSVGHILDPNLLGAEGWPAPAAPAADDIPDRVAALQNFLRKARAGIELPISTDVFGFNAWARMGYLGQDIEAFSFYVDVISPMAYPSHYARDFLPELTYFERAYEIYDRGSVRARTITGDRVLIRPYVQAFLIGGELRYEKPEYTEYLNLQIRGTIAAGGSGFSLWNNSGRYYMVDTESFLEAREGDSDAAGVSSAVGAADN